MTIHRDTMVGKLNIIFTLEPLSKNKNLRLSVTDLFPHSALPLPLCKILKIFFNSLSCVLFSDQWGSSSIFFGGCVLVCKVCHSRPLQTWGAKQQAFALTVSGSESPASRGQQSAAALLQARGLLVCPGGLSTACVPSSLYKHTGCIACTRAHLHDFFFF